ncbi:hypothetical protein Pve01_56560 [Planomonospora venezuelensis]|nr:hypothetical protein Pve01_56560 [Planomonospora venezuelensis]
MIHYRAEATLIRRPPRPDGTIRRIRRGRGEGLAESRGEGPAPEKAYLTDRRALPVPDGSALFVAEQRGFFREAGLTVRKEIVQGGAAAIPTLLSGTLDISMADYVSAFPAAGPWPRRGGHQAGHLPDRSGPAAAAARRRRDAGAGVSEERDRRQDPRRGSHRLTPAAVPSRSSRPRAGPGTARVRRGW